MSNETWQVGEPLKGFVDCRCGCADCEDRATDTYRMVGYCLNCGSRPILFLFRAGDKASVHGQTCPLCGYRGWGSGLQTVRMATADEIPAAASGLGTP